jgi:hypothetical protein
MSGQQQHKWKEVTNGKDDEDANLNAATYRMRVPGGWLYHVRTPQSHHTVFVPDLEFAISAGAAARMGAEERASRPSPP